MALSSRSYHLKLSGTGAGQTDRLRSHEGSAAFGLATVSGV